MNRFHDFHLPSSAFRLSSLRLTSHLSLLTLLFVLPAFSQQRWQKTYGGTSNDYGYSVQQTSDGGYIIAGGTNSYGAGWSDVYLIKTNALGDTIWTKTFGGVSDDYGYSGQETSDEGYIIVGSTRSFGAGGADFYLIKTNSYGDTIWTRTYGGASNDYGYYVQQTSDGGYIIVGQSSSFGAGNYDFYLIKTNASGDTLWTKTYGGTRWDTGYSVQQTEDGGYIVAGETWSFSVDYDIYLVKTNGSGDTVWTKTYGGTGWDRGNSVHQTPDSCFVIAGLTSSFGAGYYDVYLIKTNATGDTLWTHTYGGRNWDFGYSAQRTLDSGYVIVGWTGSYGGGNDDVYLIKTNASGVTIWERTYGGTSQDWGYFGRQTSDGGYIIVGRTQSFGAGGDDVYLIKTDPDGSSGVEENGIIPFSVSHIPFSVRPNPFTSFATVPGHSSERFNLYDISGRKVGTYKGDRIGEGLSAGVYFVRREGERGPLARVVKIR